MLPHFVAALGLQVALARGVAQPSVSLDWPSGQALEPGTTVTVVWENVPSEVPECELLLVLGAGRTVLRLTEELPPGSGSYQWTVPNVSAGAARLVLRMNLEGREVESPPSRPFAIQGSPDLAPAVLQWRNQEVWLSDGEIEAPQKAALPAGRGSPTPSVDTFPMDTDDPVPQPGGGLRRDEEGIRSSTSSLETLPSASETDRQNAPQSFPRRI